MGDLRFDRNNIDSYELIAKHIQKTNFLESTGLRHSVPLDLRTALYYNPDHTALNPSLIDLIWFWFPLPLNVQEYKMFNKISTVKEEVERAKYSKLITCPLFKYIYVRIKSKLERKELMHSK